jgi:DNA-binding IclR family transcriptional regulator
MDEQPEPLRFATLYTQIILQLSQQPSMAQERLARKLDVTMRTAQRHLTLLEENGYLHVDRASRPFRYTIDWSRTLAYLPELRLILFHPDVIPALRHLSDGAAEVYERALKDQQNPGDALHQFMTDSASPASRHS